MVEAVEEFTLREPSTLKTKEATTFFFKVVRARLQELLAALGLLVPPIWKI